MPVGFLCGLESGPTESFGLSGIMQKKPHAKVAKAAMSRTANWVVRPKYYETIGALITFSIAPTSFEPLADFA